MGCTDGMVWAVGFEAGSFRRGRTCCPWTSGSNACE